MTQRHGGEFDIGSGETAGLVADVQPVQIVVLHPGAFQNVVIDDIRPGGVGDYHVPVPPAKAGGRLIR